MDWYSAESAWSKFLRQIEEVRTELHCSVSNTWFRGVEDSSWSLTTSLFRHENRCDADTSKLLSQLNSTIIESGLNLAKSTKNKSILKHSLSQLKKNSNFAQSRFTQEDYEKIERKCNDHKARLAAAQRKINVLRAIHYGEREAYVEFAFRSGHMTKSSWEILAEMQHYRTPTRLLDWTEVLATSLYFALSKYIIRLFEIWEPCPGRGLHLDGSRKSELPFPQMPFDLPTPRIWILNPYRLSRLARNENALWDPTKDRRFDYFESFFVNHSWDFNYPTPAYIPWAEKRLAAQRAMFTIQGLDLRPADEQLKSKVGILQYVDITPDAAIYGVKHLMNFLGINTFAMFQDLDSLGSEIKRHFIIPNTKRNAK